MILQNDYWFDIVPSQGHGVSPSDGKWLHFGPTQELHSWLRRLDQLVEDGQITAAKVARKLPGLDPFPNKECVLCVFTAANENSKQNAQQVLKAEFDIDVTVWKSDEQTIKDWQPGGWLQVEAEVNQLRQRLQREGLGESGRARLKELLERLGQNLEGIAEPSRIAEVEISRTAKLAHQLSEELGLKEASVPSILARLDALQTQLTELIVKGPKPAPEAAVAAITEAPDDVFVIMPFAKKHVDTYDAIRRGVERANTRLRVERVDEIPGAIQITDEVRRAIRKAWLIICDLTEERPNVYYELGLAHGLAKKVICVAREGTIIHFDVYGLKTLFFDTYRSLEQQLEQEIRVMLERARQEGSETV